MKSKFNIRTLQMEGKPEAFRFQARSFPFYTFAYIVEGKTVVEVEGKIVMIGSGQFLLIPENKSILIKHYTDDCKGFEGFFTIDFLKDASYPVLQTGRGTLQSFWFDDAVFIAALLKRMLTANGDKDKALLQSGLDLILGQLRPCSKVAVVPEKFLQMVFEPDKAPQTVSEYAAQLNVTANYLNKTVKTHTYRTAIEWIEIARLNLAKKLLKDRHIPIVDVAELSGLADQSYFSRFFRKKTGMTPTQFRNSL